MLTLPVKKIVIFFVVVIILIPLFYVTFLFTKNYFQKDNTVKNNVPLEEGEFYLKSFPVDRDLMYTSSEATQKGWASRILQGIISNYSVKNGNLVSKFEYVVPSPDGTYEVKNTNIVIAIDKKNVPKRIDVFEKKGELYRKTFYSYVDTIKVWNKFGDDLVIQSPTADIDGLYYIEDFKKAFPVGSVISARIFSRIPATETRTDEYCLKDDAYMCFLSDIQDQVLGNIDNLWSGKDVTNDYFFAFSLYRELRLDE